MKSNNKLYSGFSASEGILAALMILLIIGSGYLVWTRQQNSNSSNDQATELTQSNIQPRSDQNLESNKQKTPEITEGWELYNTQFGTFNLPSSEGPLELERQTDFHGTNAGFRSDLVTYDFQFYDLSNPVIQYNNGKGHFHPCNIDVSSMEIVGVTVTLDDGSEFTTTDKDCKLERKTIEGRTFFDATYGWHHEFVSSLLTISDDESYSLVIKRKINGDEGCFTGETSTEECKALSDSDFALLEKFVEEFVKNNPDF